jgi:hypothetical protein
MTITAHRAKTIIREELERRGLPFTKLTARTVGFQDLARADCIFVQVHGWQPSPVWDELRNVAVQHGFRIEAK